MPCTYTTKTLSAGESYVLPAGAEIVFCNNSSSITSSCATIPQTPPIVCYTFDTIIEGEYIDGGGYEAWHSFKYNGFTVTFDSGNTSIISNSSDPGHVEDTSHEIYNRLHADVNLGPLILGVAVYYETYKSGVTALYGIKVRMYDLGTDPPIMEVVDFDAQNAFDGQFTMATSIGRIVDCNATITEGNGQYRGCAGDIPCPEG